MNTSIIASSKPAEKLNNDVSRKIAKHLFLICNYNPDSLVAFGDDAKFFQGVLNLYKFLVDAGICNYIKEIKKKYNLSYDSNRLGEIESIIISLRTLLGHNIDIINGCPDDIKQIENWFVSLIGKKQPSDVSEYTPALEEIKKYGAESVSILNDFIHSCSISSKINEIIIDWEKVIIKFYRRPNSRSIIENSILMAYRGATGSIDSVNRINIALWVKKEFCFKERQQNENLSVIKKGGSFSASELKKIDNRIKENEIIIKQKLSILLDRTKKIEDKLTPFDYLNYYISVMPDRIEKELEEGNVKSLLPQEIVQQIIEDDFKNISI